MVTELADEAFQVPRTLAVGIALSTDPQMMRGLLEQFCLALSDATGIEVIPRGVSSYRHLLENLESGAVDIVWLPPIIALSAERRGQVTPFALPMRGGASSYHAALFSNQASGIRELADLIGLRAAWVDPQSAAGYLIVRAHLAQQGVRLEQAFVEDMFLGSHDAVADAVLSGSADVGATFAYLSDIGRPIRAGWGHSAVRIIDKAGPIPSDVIAARAGLSSLLVRLLQSALIDVQNAQLRQAARALLSADGFCVPSREHLAPLAALLSAIEAEAERSAATGRRMRERMHSIHPIVPETIPPSHVGTAMTAASTSGGASAAERLEPPSAVSKTLPQEPLAFPAETDADPNGSEQL